MTFSRSRETLEDDHPNQGQMPGYCSVTHQAELDAMERQREGIIESIMRFENAELPSCPHCGSGNTASVQVGIMGRTIDIAAATTKIKLIPNSPKKGEYFCNECGKYFD